MARAARCVSAAPSAASCFIACRAVAGTRNVRTFFGTTEEHAPRRPWPRSTQRHNTGSGQDLRRRARPRRGSRTVHGTRVRPEGTCHGTPAAAVPWIETRGSARRAALGAKPVIGARANARRAAVAHGRQPERAVVNRGHGARQRRGAHGPGRARGPRLPPDRPRPALQPRHGRHPEPGAGPTGAAGRDAALAVRQGRPDAGRGRPRAERLPPRRRRPQAGRVRFRRAHRPRARRHGPAAGGLRDGCPPLRRPARVEAHARDP